MTGLRTSGWFRALSRRVGVDRVVLVVRLAQLPLDLVARALVGLVPRNPRLVAFGCPLDRFADNAAYVFLHAATRGDTDLEPVWISGSAEVVRRLRSLGLPAERRASLAGIRACLRAGTYVYSAYRSDVSRFLSAGARAVCLWHGLPLKRIERDAERAVRSERLRDLTREPPPDVLLSSSPYVTSLMAPAFGITEADCWELGYPRNDHLLRAPTSPPGALLPDQDAWERLFRERRVVGLFLTWRDDRATDVADSRLVERLADVCAAHGAVLAYKAHFNVAAARVTSEHVVELPPDADLNAYLGLCHVVVTDYSSVAFDFMLTDRPIVYFMPDVEEYTRIRGFYFDPLTMPGTVTRDPDQLVDAVADRLGRPDLVRDEAETAATKAMVASMWGDYDGRASEAIVEQLLRSTDGAAAVTER